MLFFSEYRFVPTVLIDLPSELKFVSDDSNSNFLAPDTGGTKFAREQPIHHRLNNDSPGDATPRVRSRLFKSIDRLFLL